MVIKLIPVLAILAYHCSVLANADIDQKKLVPEVSALISGMTKQLRGLCAGAPPSVCACAGSGGSAEPLESIAPAQASEASALKLWDCKPSACVCKGGSKAEVKRPKIEFVPKREEIVMLIKKALQM